MISVALTLSHMLHFAVLFLQHKVQLWVMVFLFPDCFTPTRRVCGGFTLNVLSFATFYFSILQVAIPLYRTEKLTRVPEEGGRICDMKDRRCQLDHQALGSREGAFLYDCVESSAPQAALPVHSESAFLSHIFPLLTSVVPKVHRDDRISFSSLIPLLLRQGKAIQIPYWRL